MNHFSVRPLRAKNRSRSLRSQHTEAATGYTSIASTATSAGLATIKEARHLGSPTSLAVNSTKIGLDSNGRPVVVRRPPKIPLGRLKRETLAALVERVIDEKLAQRMPATSEAVVAARERGASWARGEYANPANLTLEQAADHVGVSTRIINERRNEGRYYAILPQGQQRGYRFPVWEFDAPADRVAAVFSLTRSVAASGWGVHLFMLSPSSHLNGMAPWEWIADSARDLESVLRLARARFTSNQAAG